VKLSRMLLSSVTEFDAQGRPWIFWSQNVSRADGRANFEIFARVIQNGVPGAKIQISPLVFGKRSDTIPARLRPSRAP